MSGVEMSFDENNFLEAFKKGDEEAFKELMEAYKKPLINLVYSLISFVRRFKTRFLSALHRGASSCFLSPSPVSR